MLCGTWLLTGRGTSPAATCPSLCFLYSSHFSSALISLYVLYA